MLDRARFNQLWRRLGGDAPPEGLFPALARAYAEPHRAYHTAAHIADCLEQLAPARHLAERPDEVELALWFHDAVYDPRAGDNEARSAEWAATALLSGGAPSRVADRVSALILSTRHQATPPGRDAELLGDVDLSILGRSEDAFDRYDREIRVEYEWVPEATYREARAEVLDRFLRREFIYQTDHFRGRYEGQARRNLRRAIAALRDGGDQARQ